jgi:hypothetical protein
MISGRDIDAGGGNEGEGEERLFHGGELLQGGLTAVSAARLT